jgi:hypothetical protein
MAILVLALIVGFGLIVTSIVARKDESLITLSNVMIVIGCLVLLGCAIDGVSHLIQYSSDEANRDAQNTLHKLSIDLNKATPMSWQVWGETVYTDDDVYHYSVKYQYSRTDGRHFLELTMTEHKPYESYEGPLTRRTISDWDVCALVIKFKPYIHYQVN